MTPEVFLVLAALCVVSAALMWNAFIDTPRQEFERRVSAWKALGKAIELRFPQRGGDSEKICRVCVALCRSQRLPAKKTRLILASVHLRDIGIIGVPFSLLNERPMSDWTETESDAFLEHASIGAEMLQQQPGLEQIAEIVRFHHTNFDLMHGVNPRYELEANIVHLAADYVWIEKIQGTMLARENVRDGSGTRYMPELVEALLGKSDHERSRNREYATV